ncbi:MAG: MarR family transcriptional regulator [Eubacterium sp.]|nr:MarR family transcriptional regulator [Eubacterium sp.]
MAELMTTELKRLNYLISEIDAAYHEAALKIGLSDSSMTVLYAVCNSGGSCLLSEICKLSGTSKQTINSALRKLEAEGLIYLEAGEGKRKKVCLTEKGMDCSKNGVARLIALENDILASWTANEQEKYLELTQKYLACLKQKIKEEL